jgi:ribosomal-protein-alanine N-acetyltransferase
MSFTPIPAPRPIPNILTSRLNLIAITPDSLRSEQAADGRLSDILQCSVTAEWPHADWEPHVLELLLQQFADDPTNIGWHRYIVLRATTDNKSVLIGSTGGFRWPDNSHAAEIGYGILPQFRLRGYAIEATRAMIAWIEAMDTVDTIFANTFPELLGSIRILEQCGFTLEGPGSEERTIRYRRRLPSGQ